jgi:hypothetical protein
MRKLDTSPIAPGAQFFFKSGTFDHLQDAYQEVLNALALSIIGPDYEAGAVYILFGCVNSGVAPAVNVSAGAVYYNGEVYLVPATNFFLGGGQVAIGNGQLSYDMTNADPVLFSDNVPRNVHQIRTMSIVAGASGEGSDLNGNHLPDFSTWSDANQEVSITGSAVSGAFPDFVVNLPANRILYVGNLPVGDVGTADTPGYIPGTSSNTLNAIFPDLGTDNYVVDGSIIGAGDPKLDCAVTWSISNKASNGFSVTFRDTVGGVQNISFDYTIVAKS